MKRSETDMSRLNQRHLWPRSSEETLPKGTWPELSVVVPLLNEEESLGQLVERLRQELDGLNLKWEIILVDDGSDDGTWAKIAALSQADPRIKGLSLSRNFGHQNALFAGLNYARGRAIVTMDGDLQHPPELVKELLAAWQEGYKIVETIRLEGEETSRFKQVTSRGFNRIFSLLTGMPPRPGVTDFRLVDAKVADIICEMGDAHLFLRGFVYWIGYPRKFISFQPARRQAGSTKFNLMKMLRFSVAAMFSFSTIPLYFGIWIGLITGMLAFLELIYIVVRYLQGATVPGWASIQCIVSFMFAILFMLIGILGAYLSSIFEMVKHRPRFLIQKLAGFQDNVEQ